MQRIWGNEPKPGKLLDKLLVTKFRDWKYEDEVRVLVTYQGIDSLKNPFLLGFADYLIPREVILGARCVDSVENVRALAIASGLRVSVFKARLAFKTFTVVRDRRIAPDRAAKREQ